MLIAFNYPLKLRNHATSVSFFRRRSTCHSFTAFLLILFSGHSLVKKDTFRVLILTEKVAQTDADPSLKEHALAPLSQFEATTFHSQFWTMFPFVSRADSSNLSSQIHATCSPSCVSDGVLIFTLIMSPLFLSILKFPPWSCPLILANRGLVLPSHRLDQSIAPIAPGVQSYVRSQCACVSTRRGIPPAPTLTLVALYAARRFPIAAKMSLGGGRTRRTPSLYAILLLRFADALVRCLLPQFLLFSVSLASELLLSVHSIAKLLNTLVYKYPTGAAQTSSRQVDSSNASADHYADS